MCTGRARLEVQRQVVHVAALAKGRTAGAAHGWRGRRWVLLLGAGQALTTVNLGRHKSSEISTGSYDVITVVGGSDCEVISLVDKRVPQSESCDASPGGTHHSHVVLLAVCRVGAGDALRGDGATTLRRHRVHGGPVVVPVDIDPYLPNIRV